jgi:hypothetical protein
VPDPLCFRIKQAGEPGWPRHSVPQNSTRKTPAVSRYSAAAARRSTVD